MKGFCQRLPQHALAQGPWSDVDQTEQAAGRGNALPVIATGQSVLRTLAGGDLPVSTDPLQQGNSPLHSKWCHLPGPTNRIGLGR